MSHVVWTDGDYRIVSDGCRPWPQYNYEFLFRDRMGQPSWRDVDVGAAFIAAVAKSLDEMAKEPK